VARFVEKPPKEIASELLSQGRSVWNAGMFVFRADTMAGEFRKHAPELWSRLESIKTDGSNLESIYSQLPPISIDYAVMERCHQIQCIPVDLGWSDVGSWEEILRADNRSGLGGKNIEVRAAGNFYVGHGTNIKRTAFVGVQDLIVVETPDALLVMQQGSGQDVKGVVDALKSEKSSLASRHSFEDRPWGRFEILVETPRYKSKRIIVWPGQRLSYQSHTKRAEHWVVVSGDAEVTLNDVVHRLKPGQSIDIPLGAKHRMANPGSEILEFIEVQTGTYFGEDDITRYQDNYGRK
jgi:mannose-1-phosphate guanylyltransferase/mannose-1-phosphate guanylyltransferase/mannose-6-phosphate isomerase